MGWNKETRNNVILVLASVAFCLYLIEISLALFQPKDGRSAKAMKIAAERGIPFDARSVTELFYDLRSAGLDAYPAIWPGSIIRTKGLEQGLPFDGERLLPLAGISGVPTILGNENGEFSIFDSDEHGFNNPQGLHKKGEVDMVLIGDSIAQGCCVKPGEDLGSLIRERGLRALNLGYGFNGPLFELATLMGYARPLEPKLVLWLYFEGNDIVEMSQEAQISPSLMAYLEGDFFQGLAERQARIDRLLREWVEKCLARGEIDQWGPEGKRSTLMRVLTLSHLRDRIGIGGPQEPSFDVDLFGKILKKANQEVLSWGGRLFFVFLPRRERLLEDADDGTSLHRDAVLRVVADLQIPTIDTLDKLRRQSDPMALFPFGLEPHYNRKGYEVISGAIMDYLESTDAWRK